LKINYFLFLLTIILFSSFHSFYAKMKVAGRTLFPHQLTALAWAKEREADHYACGGFLCDDMGLGKTITILALMVANRLKRTLILGPLAVLNQWKLVCLSAGFAVLELDKGVWKSAGGNEANGIIHLANYDKMNSSPHAFNLNFRRIILDEAHTLRNSNSEKYKLLLTIRARRKWYLTGTPIVNSLSDFTGLMKHFQPEIPVYSEADAERAMNNYALSRKVSQVREVLGSIFPADPIVKHHLLEFSTPEEALFYRSIQGILQEELTNLMEADRLDLGAFMTLLMRLRQISVHPQVYIEAKRRERGAHYTRPNWSKDSTKTEAIVNILNEERTPSGFVIFCNFHDEMELIRERLKREHCVSTIEVYHGGMNVNARNASIESTEKGRNGSSFTNASDVLLRSQGPLSKLPYDTMKLINQMVGGRHTVLLAQLQSAGTGLNLQHMNRVIFNTPWWTAALMDQAVGRVLRLGQTDQVKIHHVLLREEMENSINIDEFMSRKVEIKRALCEQLLSAARHDI